MLHFPIAVQAGRGDEAVRHLVCPSPLALTPALSPAYATFPDRGSSWARSRSRKASRLPLPTDTGTLPSLSYIARSRVKLGAEKKRKGSGVPLPIDTDTPR